SCARLGLAWDDGAMRSPSVTTAAKGSRPSISNCATCLPSWAKGCGNSEGSPSPARCSVGLRRETAKTTGPIRGNQVAAKRTVNITAGNFERQPQAVLTSLQVWKKNSFCDSAGEDAAVPDADESRNRFGRQEG